MKNIRINEEELTKLVKKIIHEQEDHDDAYYEEKMKRFEKSQERRRGAWFTFGVYGKWVNGKTNEIMDNTPKSELWNVPIIATYNSFGEWKNSPYFETTNLPFSSKAKDGESQFEMYLKKFGPMIVKSL